MSAVIPTIASTALAFVGGYIVAKTMGSQEKSKKNENNEESKTNKPTTSSKSEQQKDEIEVDTKFSDSGEYKMVDNNQNQRLFFLNISSFFLKILNYFKSLIESLIELIRIFCITIYYLIFKFPKMVMYFIFVILICSLSFLFLTKKYRFWS